MTMYVIKHHPEDFIVDEVTSITPRMEGEYCYFWMKKKNLNTLDAVQIVGKRLGKRPKDIGYAGNKDRKAVTTQLISIAYADESAQNCEFNDISLKFIGRGNRKLALGELLGNRFTLMVRNLSEEEVHKLKNFKGDLIPNFFGEQRFGGGNQAIGKLLVKKDFKGAVEGILERERSAQKDHLKVQSQISPNDPIRALRMLDKNLLKMYLHSYQSSLYNEMLAQLIKEIPQDQWEKQSETTIPLFGFGIDPSDAHNTRIKELAIAIMKREGITARDFVFSQLPELSSEGGYRQAFVRMGALKISEIADDEEFLGMQKAKVEFTLSKGSYATVALSAMLEECKDFL